MAERIPAHQPPIPVPTPTHGPGGSFTVACGTRIAATPATCLAVILDAASYPRWNRFCRSCNIDAGGGDEGTLAPGTQFTFDVHMDLDEEVDDGDDGEEAGGQTSGRDIRGRATKLEISKLDAIGDREEEGGDDDDDGYAFAAPSLVLGDSAVAARGRKGWRVAWKTRGMPGMLLRSERVQDFLGTEDGHETDYVCWETFYGLLAPIVRLAVGAKLENGFGAWMDDLKARAEILEGRRGEGGDREDEGTQGSE
jgi:hypothetical protein